MPSLSSPTKGTSLLHLFFAVEDLFTLEEIQNQFSIGILEKVLENIFEIGLLGFSEFVPVIAQS